MTKSKTAFLLKKDWLRFAETAKAAADGWKKARSTNWTKAERKENADAYMKSYDQSMERAKSAPVKIVLHYEDGRTETIE